MEDPGSAAKTLDDVREGAQAVMVVARDRLREAGEALEAGDFQGAANRANEAQVKIAALYRAESELGSFAGKTAIRARDVRPGMEMIGEGLVEAVENVSEHGDECPSAVLQFTIEGGEVRRAYAENEILIARSGE